jgi:hypothetical protein
MASGILVYMLVLPAFLRYGFGVVEEGERKEDMFLFVGALGRWEGGDKGEERRHRRLVSRILVHSMW